MSSWLLSLALSASVLAQVSDHSQDQRQGEIRAAIKQLGSDSFSEREEASRFLWSQGLAAEEALQRTAKSRDGETRLRARQILRDFEYGIRPTVDAEIIAIIRRFRDGDGEARKRAFQQLLESGEFETLERLIRLESRPEVRRLLLEQLFADSRTIAKFIELDAIETLINAVGADQDENWRRTVSVQLMFAPKMIEHLAADKKLDALGKLIRDETQAATRQQMLLAIFGQPNAVTAILEHDQLSFLLDILKSDPEAKQRGELLSLMIGTTQTGRLLVVRKDGLDQVLHFADQHLDETARHSVLERLLLNPPILQALLEQGGLERVVQLVSQEKDAAARGRLLGLTMSSTQMRSHLSSLRNYEAVIELARQEPDEVARHEYLKALLRTSRVLYGLTEPALQRQLWELIKADKDAAWRAGALRMVLSTQRANSLLQDPDEIRWLFEVIREDAAPADRGSMLQYLLSNSQLQSIVIGQGYFDELLSLARQEPDATRGRLLRTLLTSSAGAQQLKTENRVDLLVDLAKAERNGRVRNEFLQGVFSSHYAVPALLEAGQYDTLLGFVRDEQDGLQRAELFAAFLSTPAMLEELARREELEFVLKFGNDLSDEARRAYWQRLFQNQAAITFLVSRGHYETLQSMADQDEQAYLDEFLTVPKVLELLVANNQTRKIVEFARKQKDDNVRRQFLQRLMYNGNSVELLIQSGAFDPLFELVCTDTASNRWASLVGPLLSRPEVLRHLVASKGIERLFDVIRQEPQANVRHQILYYVVGRNDTVSLLVNEGYFETLLQLVQTQPDPRQRGELLARYLTSPDVTRQLATNKRLGVLLSYCERPEQNQEMQTAYVSRLLSSRDALDALVEHGFYNDLLGLVERAADANVRATWMGQLFRSPKALDQLLARKQLDLLLSFARQAENPPVRQNYVTQLVSNERIVESLIEEQRFAELLSLCRDSTDEATRNRNLSMLLLSGRAVAKLSDDGLLEEILKKALDEPDANVRVSWLRNLCGRINPITALIQRDHFDDLTASLELAANAAARGQFLMTLASSSQIVNLLAKRERIGVLMKLIAEETEERQRSYITQRFVSNSGTLKTVIDAGYFSDLHKYVTSMSETALRNSVLGGLLSSPATIEHFATRGQLDEWFELVDQEHDGNLRRRCLQGLTYSSVGMQALATIQNVQPLTKLIEQEEDRYRQGYLSRIVSDSHLRQSWIAAGHVEELKAFIGMISNASARQMQLRQLLCAPSGLLGDHLWQGDFVQAERVIAEAEEEHPHGVLLLAPYAIERGELKEHIDQIRERYVARRDAKDALRLTYLLRAAGDLPGAEDIARQQGSWGLLRALLVERQAWREAAELQAKVNYPPPLATSPAALNSTHQRIEQLGLLAAYQRLGGDKPGLQATVDEVQRLAETNQHDRQLAWHGAEALMLNDEFDAGLKLAANSRPMKAFRILSHRHQYDEALQLVGWSTEKPVDRAWLDGLPSQGDSDSEQSRSRFDAALQVARTLQLLGQRDKAEQVFAVLEDYTNSIPEQGVYPGRQQYWEQFGLGLFQMGRYEEAWEAAARGVHSNASYAPSFLSQAYSARGHEAVAWWMFFRAAAPQESVSSLLRRIWLVLVPASDESATIFDEVVTQAIEFGELAASREAMIGDSEFSNTAYAEVSDTLQDKTHAANYWLGIGETCKMRGRDERAIECLRRAAPMLPEAAMKLASLLRDGEQWQEAADLYEQIWKADREQLGALYLSGHALCQAGQTELGKGKQELASLLALLSRARHKLSLDLLKHGLADDAATQWELLLRTAPLESWELNDAARRLADHLLTNAPTRSAALWEHYMLGDLRTSSWFQEDVSYVRMPFLIHKMRALGSIQAGETETARQQIDLARLAAPGDTRLAEELAPVLQANGHIDMAESLVDQILRHYRKRCHKYPEAAYFHNNLAWVAARCHRHLDEALGHAEKAVQLEPHHGGYVDTLAEVHFHLGDRSAAVRFAERAVKLRPFDSALASQLHRFRHDPLP